MGSRSRPSSASPTSGRLRTSGPWTCDEERPVEEQADANRGAGGGRPDAVVQDGPEQLHHRVRVPAAGLRGDDDRTGRLPAAVRLGDDGRLVGLAAWVHTTGQGPEA